MSIAYASGVTSTSSSGRSGPQSFSGFTATAGGSSAIAGTLSGASIQTTGVGITGFARLAAPPQKLRSGQQAVGCLTVLVTVGFAAWAGISKNDLGIGLGPATVFVGIGLFVLLAIRAFFYNRTTYPRLLDAWKRSWICAACGKVFQP